MLIQQRQPFKQPWPNKWDISIGGSAIKGETSQIAATRETFEELGINLDLDSIRPQMTINFPQGFDDIYLVTKDIDLNELKLQAQEVQKVKWTSQNEIIEMIENGNFIPYFPNLIKTFFDMQNTYGCYNM